MHIISQRRIREAEVEYPTVVGALKGWLRLVKNGQFTNYAELKRIFSSVDKVGAYYIFDIGGNHLRLIASIHFNRQKLYIKHILTHKEYDKNDWKK